MMTNQKAVIGMLLVLTGVAGSLSQQRGGGMPDGETVLKRIEEHWAPVKEYAVTLEVVADIERMVVPPTVVRMYYKQPDKMHFETEGFALLPRDALRFNPHGIRERFSVEAVGRDTTDGAYRLRLISRGEASPARRLTMIVDSKEYTVKGLESGTADGRHMKASFTHTAIGGVMLPSMLVVEFSSDAPPDPPSQDPVQGPVRPRRGKVTITFRDYVVNGGIPDELFEKKEPN